MIRFKTILLLVLFFILISIEGTYAKHNKYTRIRILFSSDTYGCIEGCKCPRAPQGGLSRRSSLIDSLRSYYDNLLVLDGGDFVGGSKYDLKSENRILDSLKTFYTLLGYASIGYDAIGIGGEDFVYKKNFLKYFKDKFGLNFISLNLEDNDFSPYLKRVFKDVNVYVVSILGDNLKEYDSLYYSKFYRNFRDKLDNFLKEKRDSIDLLVILNAMGEDSISVIDSIITSYNLNKKTIIFNSFYKKTRENYFRTKHGIPVIDFYYYSKLVSYVEVKVFKDKIRLAKLKNIPIAPRLNRDEKIDNLISDYNYRKKSFILLKYSKLPMKFFISSSCVHCQEGLKSIMGLILKYKDKLNPTFYYFFETKQDSLEFVLQFYNNEKYLEYMFYKYSKGMSNFDSLLKKIKINKDSLIIALKNNRYLNYFKQNDNNIKKYEIEGTPTVYINGREFEYNLEYGNLIAYLCWISLGKVFEECGGGCNSNGIGCENIGGFISECINGDCAYKKDAEFNFYVIYDSLSYIKYDKDIIKTTKALFPNVKIIYLDYRNKKAKEFIYFLGVSKLPFFVADSLIRYTYNFAQVRPAFINVGKYYVLSPDNYDSKILLDRPKKEGNISVLFSPFAPDLEKNPRILEIILDLYKKGEISDIGFIVLREGDSLITIGGRPELEEIARMEAVKLKYKNKKKKFITYLKNKYKYGVTSSYWEDPLKKSKIKPKKIKKLAKSKEVKDRLNDYSYIFSDIPITFYMYVLIDNRELIPLDDINKLFKVIDYNIKRRKLLKKEE